MKTDRIVVDAIHGAIELTALERHVVDTASFQRLRSLKQLGFGHVTYPNATHTRFAHSLGVLAVMSRVVRVTADDLTLSLDEQQDLRLAALLHDIGHYPYSHLMERLDDVVLTEDRLSAAAPRISIGSPTTPYPDHESLGRIIVTSQQDLVEAIGDRERAERIADLFTRDKAADQQRSKLIHSSLDMDRLDYLLRDARAAGVPYGEIDLPYLLNNVRVSPTGMIGIKYKALPAAEQFLLARYFMHKTVYYHKTTFALEEACRQLLRRCRDAGKYDVPGSGIEIEEVARDRERLLQFTDQEVDQIVRRALQDDDIVNRGLAEAIIFRRPPKLLREASALVDMNNKDHTKYNAAADFLKSCVANLRQLAQQFQVPEGQFLLAQTRPLQLEKRGALVAVEVAKSQPTEKEDELIKVFTDNGDEPKSLVEINESLVSLCASHASLSTRLYVVENDSARVSRMRAEAQNW